MNNPVNRTVIIADGSFPVHDIPLSYIRSAARIICCDGSTKSAVDAGINPYAIVGDMDSISEDLVFRFADRIHTIEEQETNDLTKTVNWCTGQGFNDLVITGATGKREDHTLGNISLLADYMVSARVLMVTDTGFFIPLSGTTELPSFPGQQISVFSIECGSGITSQGLRYPLKNSKITNWWQATLNESSGEKFTLEFSAGRLLVYLKF